MYVFLALLMSGNLFGMKGEIETQGNKNSENTVATNYRNLDEQARLGRAIGNIVKFLEETPSEISAGKKEEEVSLNKFTFENFVKGIKAIAGEIKQDINKVGKDIKKGIKDITEFNKKTDNDFKEINKKAKEDIKDFFKSLTCAGCNSVQF